MTKNKQLTEMQRIIGFNIKHTIKRIDGWEVSNMLEEMLGMISTLAEMAKDKDEREKTDMEEEVFTGDKIAAAVLNSENIEEFNSIRWWVNGKEVRPEDVMMVVYNDPEQ